MNRLQQTIAKHNERYTRPFRLSMSLGIGRINGGMPERGGGWRKQTGSCIGGSVMGKAAVDSPSVG